MGTSISDIAQLQNTMTGVAQNTKAKSAERRTDTNEKTTGATQNTQAGSGAERTSRSETRAALNAQIVSSMRNVSLKAGNNPQALMVRSALDNIYNALRASLGSNQSPDANQPDAVETRPLPWQGAETYPPQEDTSPEAYANKILSGSLKFFDAYAARHSGENPENLRQDFVNLVQGAFEKGFNEAVDILKSLKVFSGNVESEINQTYDLVMKGYQNFLAGPSQETEEAGSSPKVE